MLLSFDKILANKENGFYRNFLRLPHDAFDNKDGVREFEVKLLIDGKEYDPIYLKDQMDNIDKHIKYEANKIITGMYGKKIETLNDSIEVLNDIIDDIKDKIRDKAVNDFNLKYDDDGDLVYE